MFEKIKKLLFLRKILHDKKRQLWATEADLSFFMTEKKEYTDRNAENKLRQKLEAEAKKDSPNQEAVDTISEKINEARNTYSAYYKTKQLQKELPIYIRHVRKMIKEIKLFDLWNL